jgi:hypothetical protein
VGLDEEIVEAAAVTRKRTERSSKSETSVTWTRLGKKRVRVLRLEWLTLLPDWTAIPVSSQRRAIELRSFERMLQLDPANMKAGRSNQEAPRLPLGLAKR